MSVRLWNDLIISKSYYGCTNNRLTAMRNSSAPLKGSPASRETFFRNFGKKSKIRGSTDSSSTFRLALKVIFLRKIFVGISIYV